MGFFFCFVFACFFLMWPEQQVRHHQTSGPHASAASAPPLPLRSLCLLLQQGPQGLGGLWNGAPIASLPIPRCAVHPVPVLCVHSLLLLHQSPSSSSSSSRPSCLLPILLRLLLPHLPPCPCPTPTVGVQHTDQPVLHWERLWGGHGAEAGPVGESGRSPASAVKWVSGAPFSREMSHSFLFLAGLSPLHSLQVVQ